MEIYFGVAALAALISYNIYRKRHIMKSYAEIILNIWEMNPEQRKKMISGFLSKKKSA